MKREPQSGVLEIPQNLEPVPLDPQTPQKPAPSDSTSKVGSSQPNPESRPPKRAPAPPLEEDQPAPEAVLRPLGAADFTETPLSLRAPASPKATKLEELYEDDLPPLKKRRGPSGGYYLECFLREVLTNIRHNPMMSVASISTVLVLALILGFFILVIANLDSLAKELAGEMHIKVYMDSSFDPQKASAFKTSAYAIGHVAQVNFVPKDQAFARLRQRLNAKLDLSDLEGNPLPDAFEIPVDSPDFLEPVAHKLAQLPHVATVDYGREEAQKLLRLNQIIHWVGLVILAMLLASTLLIISNTIRLTVFARRKEIDIMQLVGAADWFIRWPFILEGVSQGMIGAALAATLIDVSYRIVVPQIYKSITFLPILQPNEILPQLNIGLIALGCLVGALGSLISVNRYLKA